MQVQIAEQMSWIGRGNDNRRMLAKGGQKRLRHILVRGRQPQKNQRTLPRPDAGERIFSKRTSLAETQPAGALKIVSKLASAYSGIIKGEVGLQEVLVANSQKITNSARLTCV